MPRVVTARYIRLNRPADTGRRPGSRAKDWAPRRAPSTWGPAFLRHFSEHACDPHHAPSLTVRYHRGVWFLVAEMKTQPPGEEGARPWSSRGTGTATCRAGATPPPRTTISSGCAES